VIGTTGFTPAQKQELEKAITGRVPAVMTSNFSVGANMLFGLASSLRSLPREFDVSIMEAHHSGKADAPSGTALRLGEIVSKARGYSSNIHGRSGISKRQQGELEIVSLRGGGAPGEHAIFAFGPHEVLKLEHTVYSRSAFAQGALVAAEWVSTGMEKRIYSMLDVLGFGA
jgi:4-hydroxy-tetrahydrodipicolinate reductase